MNKIAILITLFFIAFTFNTLNAQQEEKFTKLTFDKTDHDFGTLIEENGPTTCTFTFKNVGDEPLVIKNVQASCGCTTPDWTKTPVMPGKEGYIKATYAVTGRPGSFNKSITVTCNVKERAIVLTIKGNVIKKAEAEKKNEEQKKK
jgi:hypothetical protein